MVFIQWHIGDWISGTSLLSATERGVYFDLLMRYYGAERPLMQTECKRIARAYDEHEQKALQYVLSEFFTLEDGAYRHRRCDHEIAAYQEKVEKRSKAAKSRWAKSRKENGSVDSDQYDASAHANADASEYADADAGGVQKAWEPITSNHKPIKEKNTREEPSPASPTEAEEPSDEAPKKRPARGEYAKCSYEGLDGVSDELWADWTKLRKRKRATVTQRVIDGLAKEASKAGLSLEAAMETQIERGWSSFKAEWVSRSGGSYLPANRSKPLSEMNYDSYDALYGPGV